MASFLRPTAIALSFIFLASCGTHSAPDPSAQSLVEQVASAHQDVTRLTVHAKPADGKDFVAIASTSSDKLAKASDPEDKKAIQTGQVIVLEEAGGFDVTVPMCQKNSVYTAAAGITFKAGITRDAAINQAKAIASTLDSKLMAAPKN